MTNIGDYTFEELQALTPDVLERVKAAGFIKDPADVSGRPAYAGLSVGSTVTPVFEQPQPSGNVWARKKAGADFICPSGQTCRLRPLEPEALLLEGILDQITRLDGLAQQLINASSGLPPEKRDMPSREDLAELLILLNKLTVLAVAEPQVYPDDAPDAPEDSIRVSDIDLVDRMAIMEEALKGVKSLDKFRHP